MNGSSDEWQFPRHWIALEVRSSYFSLVMPKKAASAEKKPGDKKAPAAKGSSGKAKKSDEDTGDKGKARAPSQYTLPIDILTPQPPFS